MEEKAVEEFLSVLDDDISSFFGYKQIEDDISLALLTWLSEDK